MTVLADSNQTMLCTYLSAALLVSLALNAALGWSWADPAAAPVIAGVAVEEGVGAWRGEHRADCAPAGAAPDACGAGCCGTEAI